MCLRKIFCCFESKPLNEDPEEGAKNGGFDETIGTEQVKISQAPAENQKIEENHAGNQRNSFEEKDLPTDPSKTTTSMYYADTINESRKE